MKAIDCARSRRLLLLWLLVLSTSRKMETGVDSKNDALLNTVGQSVVAKYDNEGQLKPGRTMTRTGSMRAWAGQTQQPRTSTTTSSNAATKSKLSHTSAKRSPGRVGDSAGAGAGAGAGADNDSTKRSLRRNNTRQNMKRTASSAGVRRAADPVAQMFG